MSLSDLGFSPAVARLRELQPLESTKHLSPEQEIKRNLSFIDARHLEAAESFVEEKLLLSEWSEQARHLHKFYLKDFSGNERGFETKAWDNFNICSNYVDALIRGTPDHAWSGLPDVKVILRINALLQFGSVPADPVSVMRDSYGVTGVYRETQDVLRCFDTDGHYKSRLFSPPPVFGFCSREQFIAQHEGLSVIGLLRELKENRPVGARRALILRELESRTSREPHSVASTLEAKLQAKLQKQFGEDEPGKRLATEDPERFFTYKRIQLISALSRAKVGSHLNTVCNEFEQHARKIIERYGSQQALEAPNERVAFSQSVVRLATHFGSVIDMNHFADDGMGRTNLQLERLIMGLFGLERPVPLAVVQEGRSYENGTYVYPKEVRVGAITDKLPPLDVEKTLSRMKALQAPLAAGKGSRLNIERKE